LTKSLSAAILDESGQRSAQVKNWRMSAAISNRKIWGNRAASVAPDAAPDNLVEKFPTFF
jgi:hypothetical protein